jgi:predicted amidohydrolase YtcJ
MPGTPHRYCYYFFNDTATTEIYTKGSAWFTHDDEKRGMLAPGRLADLAVLSKDYASVGADEIGGIESLLTMVGGRIVYASGPFAALEDRPAN